MSIRSNMDPRGADERITFERNTPTQTATGDLPDNFQPLKACWAKVDGAKAFGAEPSFGGATFSRGDYTVWVRSDIITRFAITPADRILWKDKILNIKDIPDQGLRSRWMPIICNAGLNAG